MKVAFDCMGTLDKHPEIASLARTMERSPGVELVVWSGGGIDYARETCKRLGIQPYQYANKNQFPVDLAFDDEPDTVYTAKKVVQV